MSKPSAFSFLLGSRYQPETSLTFADKQTREEAAGKMGGFITDDAQTFSSFMGTAPVTRFADNEAEDGTLAKANSAAAVQGAKGLRGWFGKSAEATPAAASGEATDNYGPYSDITNYRHLQHLKESDRSSPAYYNPNATHEFAKNMGWLADDYHRRMIRRQFPNRSTDEIDRKYSSSGVSSFNDAVMHFGGLSVDRIAPPKNLAGLSQFRRSIGGASAECGIQLQSFESCLSANGNDSSNCLNAWDSFLACSENDRM